MNKANILLVLTPLVSYSLEIYRRRYKISGSTRLTKEGIKMDILIITLLVGFFVRFLDEV